MIDSKFLRLTSARSGQPLVVSRDYVALVAPSDAAQLDPSWAHQAQIPVNADGTATNVYIAWGQGIHLQVIESVEYVEELLSFGAESPSEELPTLALEPGQSPDLPESEAEEKDTFCSVCSSMQYRNVLGYITCVNGHTDAPGLENEREPNDGTQAKG